MVVAFNIGFDVKGLREWGANHHICIYFQFELSRKEMGSQQMGGNISSISLRLKIHWFSLACGQVLSCCTTTGQGRIGNQVMAADPCEDSGVYQKGSHWLISCPWGAFSLRTVAFHWYIHLFDWLADVFCARCWLFMGTNGLFVFLCSCFWCRGMRVLSPSW